MAAPEGKSGKTFVTQRAKVGYRDDPAKQHDEEAEAFEDAQASQTSQSTLLLQKKKLMEEAQIELDRKKEEIRLRMLRCQEKEDELALTQADLINLYRLAEPEEGYNYAVLNGQVISLRDSAYETLQLIRIARAVL